MAGFDFKKSSRLLASPEFDRVFRNSSLRVSHRLLLILACPNTLQHPRLGLVIAKKHIRHATDRNRVKRRLRETFRLQQHQLPPVDAIVLARAGLDQLDDQALNALFNQQWQRLCDFHRKEKLGQISASKDAANGKSAKPQATATTTNTQLSD